MVRNIVDVSHRGNVDLMVVLHLCRAWNSLVALMSAVTTAITADQDVLRGRRHLMVATKAVATRDGLTLVYAVEIACANHRVEQSQLIVLVLWLC